MIYYFYMINALMAYGFNVLIILPQSSTGHVEQHLHWSIPTSLSHTVRWCKCFVPSLRFAWLWGILRYLCMWLLTQLVCYTHDAETDWRSCEQSDRPQRLHITHHTPTHHLTTHTYLTHLQTAQTSPHFSTLSAPILSHAGMGSEPMKLHLRRTFLRVWLSSLLSLSGWGRGLSW